MSYRGMLKHRCSILELREQAVDGSPVVEWVEVASDIRCFLDLNFIRHGKDPIWTAEAGRPSDRSGVLFLLGDAPIRSGYRIRMSRGPAGTFQIQGAIDEAWAPSRKHHIEVGVVEIAPQLARPQYSMPQD